MSSVLVTCADSLPRTKVDACRNLTQYSGRLFSSPNRMEIKTSDEARAVLEPEICAAVTPQAAAWAVGLAASAIALALVWPSEARRTSRLSYRSLWSVLSASSVLSIASAASLLSVGSFASVLSVGSSHSVLSVGSDGGFLSIGRTRRTSMPED